MHRQGISHEAFLYSRKKKQFMRLILNILLCLSALSYTSAQTDVYYTVNIGTFVDAQRSDFQSLRPYGFVYAQTIEDNLQQIYVGGTNDRATAEQILRNVRNTGFPGAYIQEKLEVEGKPVAVIQIATLDTRKAITWDKYVKVPNLFGIVRDNQLKLVQGVYTNIAETRTPLEKLRQQGFADAFSKTVNSIYLFPVKEFETGIAVPKKPLFELGLNQDDTSTGQQPDTPTSYNNTATPSSGMSARSGNSPAARTNASGTPLPPADQLPAAQVPNIRPDVKRRSALELQKILKQSGTYSGSLDGYYGPGTQAAYQQFTDQNRDYHKYRILADNLSFGAEIANDNIQQSINQLPDDMAALRTLEASNAAVAKAYVAYTRFVNSGPGTEVDVLMNAALRETFRSMNTVGMPRFDPEATYTYTNLEQIIKHLYYLHAAPGMTYAAPCWLIARHPEEIRRVQQQFREAGGTTVPRTQTCGQFSEWPTIRVLLAVARDLNPSPDLDESQLAQAASLRTQYFYAQEPLSEDMEKVLANWEKRLWMKAGEWAAADPLHQRLMHVFKASYYQSLVLMEDYFMNNGFTAPQAKTLALATQRTLVGYHVDRFTRY